MSKKKGPFILSIIVVIIISCNFPWVATSKTPTTDELASVSATINSGPTETVTITPVITTTSSPTANDTETLTPTKTVLPSSTPTIIPCNVATYVNDLTIPDGTEIPVGTSFVKTWRIKNSGSCTWNSSYALVYAGGDNIGTSASYPFPSVSVASGETVDISITLGAPVTPGEYKVFFKFRTPDGTTFGTGTDGNSSIWADFKTVASPTKTSTRTPTPTKTVKVLSIGTIKPVTTLIIPKPDLEYGTISFSPTHIRMDQVETVVVSVQNNGSGTSSGSFEIEWYADASNASPSCTWIIMEHLAPGGITIQSCEYTFHDAESSDQQSKVVIDPGNDIAESDESDNIKILTLHFYDT